MKKPVTYLGDAFYYLLTILVIVVFLWIVITPAKYFVANEIYKIFQNKGEMRSINKINKILANHNITRANYKPSIIIRKKTRELTLYANAIKIATYTIGISRVTVGRKQQKDDLKTPEGNYHICNKVLNHKYHMLLQINYPSQEDASRGNINHIISNEEEIKIAQAEASGVIPPDDTELGGNIGIHGFGSESNWTKDGSISLDNVDIEEIFWNVDVGCPVLIMP